MGDALTRTIKLRAADVPGMVFPPVSFRSHDGLGVYPKPPAVADSTQRGEFTGQRIETVTYICEKAGIYTLPALTIPWFDVDDEQLKRVELPAVTVEVIATPRLALDSPPSESSQLWWSSGAVCVILVTVLLFWRFRRRLATRIDDWRARRAESEAAYFARLKIACQSDNPAMTLDALTHWIDRVNEGEELATVDQFVCGSADADLRRQKEELDRLLFAASPAPHGAWSGQAFYQRVAAVRKHMQRGKTRLSARAFKELPPLNP